MGFYLRKAFRAGPIRFNLSRGGIGISAGVTGARLGLSSSGGAFVHGGRGGVYYRKSVGNWSGSAESDADTALAIELTEETGATFGVPDQPEEADRTEAPARPKSTSGGLIAAGRLLAAFLGDSLVGCGGRVRVRMVGDRGLLPKVGPDNSAVEKKGLRVV